MPDDVLRLHKLSAVDTWMFGSGQPFNQDDEGLSQVRSIFPPLPSSVFGALRAAYARAAGWDGISRWDSKDANAFTDLGNGLKDLGCLSACGPFVSSKEGSIVKYWIPAPHALAVKMNGLNVAETTRADPIKTGFKTDLGLEHLCQVRDKNPETFKSAHGFWLSFEGLAAYLKAEEVPKTQSLRSPGAFIHREHRVGLEINPKTGTAAKGMLYSASHLRPGKEISLVMRWQMSKPKHNWDEVSGLHPLGGESRLANIETLEANIDPVTKIKRMSEKAVNKMKEGRYSVVLLTPLPLQETKLNGNGLFKALNLPGKLVTLSTHGIERIGGQDDNGSTASVPALPAGTVLFGIANEKNDVSDLLDQIPIGLGQDLDKRHGFGGFALGTWNLERKNEQDK
ncbi:type III-B CRISPR module-associated Cmr3 family protein [Woodsholea maritima]|uniref:type III-B CRISPR module-associated Cmr3 family protein n=1 Tax=Woodsholea maritima TaxID=240237 RepID=UPI000363FDCF|nr:type III-B CRISPR module-associated Cmr3 family protein [Woodsholea maritima]